MNAQIKNVSGLEHPPKKLQLETVKDGMYTVVRNVPIQSSIQYFNLCSQLGCIFYIYPMHIELSFIYRDKPRKITLRVNEKAPGMVDYILTHKNGYTFYIFRKESGVWKHVYGSLPADLAKPILEALSKAIDSPSNPS
jgi:hypothetical protein